MKLPKKVIIFGQTFSIKTEKKPTLNGDYVDGFIDLNKAEITIDCEAKDKARVLVHEMFHGLCERLNISVVIGDSVEEILSEAVARMVYENFKMTPHPVHIPRKIE